MRGQQMIERKTKAGEIGQCREKQKPERPAVKPLVGEHAEHDHEARSDGDKTDDDMQNGIGGQTEYAENHDQLLKAIAHVAKPTISERAPSHAGATFGHAPMTEC